MRNSVRICAVLSLAMCSELYGQQLQNNFMRHGRVQRGVGTATVVSNDPRPLYQAIVAVRKQYEWVVNYEDPPFASNSELTDIADSKWRISHPGKSGLRIPAGGNFESSYPESSTTFSASDQEEQLILKKLVSDYNRSSNPGNFVVRKLKDGSYAVVGNSVRNSDRSMHQTVPILDTSISVQSDTRDLLATMKIIFENLSQKAGVKVIFGPSRMGSLVQKQVLIGGDNVPARVLISEALANANLKLTFDLLYDANVPMYVVNFSLPQRESPSMFEGVNGDLN